MLESNAAECEGPQASQLLFVFTFVSNLTKNPQRAFYKFCLMVENKIINVTPEAHVRS